MEYSASIIDPHDELRKLQDKVRRLEIQNEQLRSQNSNRNGLIEKLGCDNVAGTGDNAELGKIIKSSSSLDSCQLIEIDEDYLDHETWLEKSLRGQGKNRHLDIQAVLHQDINSNDNDFQLMRRSIVQRIEDSKQVSVKAIDTRTFPRPKKRISRPALETMLESPVPVLENRQLLSSPWFSLKNMQNLGDNIDDISLMLDSLSSLTSEPENANQTFCKTDFLSRNSSPHISFPQAVETKDNASFHLTSENSVFNRTFQRHNASGQAFQRKTEEQGNINATNLLIQDNTIRSMHIEQDVPCENTALNCTFSVVDGGGSSGSSRRSGRTASCESGLDEDQLSSASDSSYSSATKPMNVGDVQIIANIQEESLKQANSTPVRGFMEGSFSNLGEDLPSPIVHHKHQDVNHGYQSDHSDHSSADSRAKSSRSSVRSSPSSSPRGSTTLLSNVHDNAPYQLPAGSPNRELEGISPSRQLARDRPAAQVLRQTEGLRGRPTFLLRPPSIRPPRSGGQPQARPASGIPRPPSRLPAPRIRASLAGQAANKNNAVHGYY